MAPRGREQQQSYRPQIMLLLPPARAATPFIDDRCSESVTSRWKSVIRDSWSVASRTWRPSWHLEMLRFLDEILVLLPSDPWHIFFSVCAAVVIFVTLAGNDAGNMSKSFSWEFRLAASLRTPILVFFVVPLSFATWVYRQVVLRWRLLVRGLEASRATHSDRVKPVVDSINQWNAAGRPGKLRTARPNWAAMSTKLSSNKGNAHCVPVTQLDHILELNLDEMSVTCEPNVNMGMITAFLVPRGYALQVPHLGVGSVLLSCLVCRSRLRWSQSLWAGSSWVSGWRPTLTPWASSRRVALNTR